jgi:hypothetical protein
VLGASLTEGIGISLLGPLVGLVGLVGLLGLRGTATVIVIAYGLSTLPSADHIALLEGGRIVQFGTWDALMTTEGDGPFALLVRAGAVLEDVAG